MAYIKTVWIDRQVQYPLTFTQTNNANGTITLVPAEGTVSQAGTPICALNLNKMEDAIYNNDISNVKKNGDIMTGSLTVPVLISNTADGTSPFLVTSTTKVDNLNVDMVDGYHATDFLLASGYTASDILIKIKGVDGSGSGLDADLIDGIDSSAFARKDLTTDQAFNAGIVLPNSKALWSRNAGGTSYAIFYINGSNQVLAGNTALPIFLYSSSAPVWFNGTTNYTLYHTGSFSYTTTNTANALVQRDANGDVSFRIGNANRILLTSVPDLTLTMTNPAFQLTHADGSNMIMDNNEIQCRMANNTVNTLWLNKDGGNISMGNSVSTINIAGALTVGGTSVSLSDHTHGTLYATSSINSVTIFGSNFRPTSTSEGSGDNTITCGSPSYRWKTVYAGTATINTSDKRQKKDIEAMSEIQIEFFKRLLPVSYKFIDNDSNRTHYGFISQDVEKIMEEVGLTSLDFAGFIKSPIYENNETNTGAIIDYVYGLRYSEFIALNTYVLQRVMEEAETMKKDIEVIKQFVGMGV